MKLSSRARMFGRNGIRIKPYHVPASTLLSEADQKYIDRQKQNRYKNKAGNNSKSKASRSSSRYTDIDYSYERMELRDRLLDMNPAPPPFADVMIRWDLDIEPQLPPSLLAYDAYNDPDNDKDNDKDEDEGKDNDVGNDNGEFQWTKDTWEKQYKTDNGTFIIDSYYQVSSSIDAAKQPLSAPMWDFLQNFLQWELGYTFPSSWLSSETPMNIMRIEDESSGTVNLRFVLEYPKGSRKNAWFTIPIGNYDPRDNGTPDPDPTAEPEPEPEPNDEQTTKDESKDQWIGQYYDKNTGFYEIPTIDPLKTVPFESSIYDNWTENDVYNPSSPETQWLINYLTFVRGIQPQDVFKDFNWLKDSPNQRWAFIVHTNEDLSVTAMIQLFNTQTNINTGKISIQRGVKFSIGNEEYENPPGYVFGDTYTGELIKNFQPTAEEKFNTLYVYETDSKTGIQKFKVPDTTFQNSGPVGQFQVRLSDTEWQYLQDFMKYSPTNYILGTKGKIEKQEWDTNEVPESRDTLFNIVRYSNPSRLVLSSRAANSQWGTFMVMIPL